MLTLVDESIVSKRNTVCNNNGLKPLPVKNKEQSVSSAFRLLGLGGLKLWRNLFNMEGKR